MRVIKVGDGLAVALPADIVEQLGLPTERDERLQDIARLVDKDEQLAAEMAEWSVTVGDGIGSQRRVK